LYVGHKRKRRGGWRRRSMRRMLRRWRRRWRRWRRWSRS